MRPTVVITLIAALAFPAAFTRAFAGPGEDKPRPAQEPAADVRGPESGRPPAPEDAPPRAGEGREGEGHGGRMGFFGRKIFKNAYEARMEAERLRENTQKLEEDRRRLKRDREKLAKDPKSKGLNPDTLERREKILELKSELVRLEKKEFIVKTRQNTAYALEEIGRRRTEAEKSGRELPPMLGEFEASIRSLNEAAETKNFDELYDIIANSDDSIDMGIGDPGRIERLRRERDVLRRRLSRIEQELGLSESPDGMPPPPLDGEPPPGPPGEDAGLYKGMDAGHPGPPSREDGPPPRGEHPRRPR